MKYSTKASAILDQFNAQTKLGDLRKIAKEIKKDHALAMELWSFGSFLSRQLAILIMDSRVLNKDLIDELVKEMGNHPYHERLQLIDWFMANQLMKDKKLIHLLETWENSDLSLQRRVFWYYQGRLRWVGQIPPKNTPELLSKIEMNIEDEVPEVQWAMNFTAGWIGVYEAEYRHRCVEIGKRTGLYKNDKVSRGCTPNYLPEFIRIESEKRQLS